VLLDEAGVTPLQRTMVSLLQALLHFDTGCHNIIYHFKFLHHKPISLLFCWGFFDLFGLPAMPADLSEASDVPPLSTFRMDKVVLS